MKPLCAISEQELVGADSKRRSQARSEEATGTASKRGSDVDRTGTLGQEQEFEVNVFEGFNRLKKPMKLRADLPFKGPGAKYQPVGEPKLNAFQEFWVLVCRASKLMLRNKNMTWFRLVVTLFTAFVPSFMYFQ